MAELRLPDVFLEADFAYIPNSQVGFYNYFLLKIIFLCIQKRKVNE